MTELADKIVSALFDLADSDGGLVKSRAVERVDEVLAKMSFGCNVPRGAVAIWVSPDGVDFIYPDEQTEADKQREAKAQEFAKRDTDRSHQEDWDAWKKSIASVPMMPKQYFYELDKTAKRAAEAGFYTTSKRDDVMASETVPEKMSVVRTGPGTVFACMAPLAPNSPEFARWMLTKQLQDDFYNHLADVMSGKNTGTK